MKQKMSRISLVLLAVSLTTLTIILYANFRNPQKELLYELNISHDVRSEQFKRVLGTLMGPDIVAGNKVRGLYNGDEIFPAMLEAIASAKKTISFESYIYWSGTIGNQFADALSERAQNNVKVHLLIDWLGSQRIDDEIVDRMKNAGVEIEYYHPLKWYNVSRMNNRTHRKLLIVDGVRGFTGGVGIADEWTGDGLQKNKWRDSHFEAEGPVIAQMQSAFMDNWLKLKPQVPTGTEYFPKIPNAGNSQAQMFKSSIREGTSSVRIMYLLAIAAAKKTIYLENSYFLPDDSTIQELVKARKRGVKVQIITPRYIDSDFLRLASRRQWRPLLEAGVQFFEYKPALFHCKVLIVDDYFVSIGSTNFDERSFRLNDEANLNVFDEEFAKKQVEIFERDRSHSHEITYGNWKNRSLFERSVEKLSIIFYSQL